MNLPHFLPTQPQNISENSFAIPRQLPSLQAQFIFFAPKLRNNYTFVKFVSCHFPASPPRRHDIRNLRENIPQQ
jgi:hypothetical protein